jgi:hypothetical protein
LDDFPMVEENRERNNKGCKSVFHVLPTILLWGTDSTKRVATLEECVAYYYCTFCIRMIRLHTQAVHFGDSRKQQSDRNVLVNCHGNCRLVWNQLPLLM